MLFLITLLVHTFNLPLTAAQCNETTANMPSEMTIWFYPHPDCQGQPTVWPNLKYQHSVTGTFMSSYRISRAFEYGEQLDFSRTGTELNGDIWLCANYIASAVGNNDSTVCYAMPQGGVDCSRLINWNYCVYFLGNEFPNGSYPSESYSLAGSPTGI